jgi:hypothetical protein
MERSTPPSKKGDTSFEPLGAVGWIVSFQFNSTLLPSLLLRGDFHAGDLRHLRAGRPGALICHISSLKH